MSDKIKLLATGINVQPIYWALMEHPELWNQNKERTQNPTSPHRELDDIWARFGEAEHVGDGDSHDSKWYPAADILGIKQLCFDTLHQFNGVELGGVLITRVPPGKTCYPHKDLGWHATRYDKFAIQIASAPGQHYQFEDAKLETKPGDVFWFDNSYTHWVTNESAYERITLIICIRRDK